MPVDPDISLVLQQLSEVRSDFDSSITPQEFRNLADSFDRTFGNEIHIDRVEDIRIPVDKAEIKGRFYSDYPESESLIVYFHGGGFVIGNIDGSDSVCRMIAKKSGSKVISVDYRLAPENKFPVPVEDAFNSYRWIRENAERFGVDVDRIAVSGDSAGGNLSAALCLKAIDDEYPLPKLNVMFYPVVTSDTSSESFREYSNDLILTRGMMNWFHNHYVRSHEDLMNPYFAPILSDKISMMPETIVVTAEFDPLRDQGETYVADLRRNSVKATGIRAMGMIHGFLGYFPVSSNAHNILTMVSSLVGNKLKD